MAGIFALRRAKQAALDSRSLVSSQPPADRLSGSALLKSLSVFSPKELLIVLRAAVLTVFQPF
jgi:hypothetical protein